MEKKKETDVLIIGGGIIGLSIVRELSKYQVDVTAVEREADISMGISKTGGSLIYMGLFQALSLVVKDLGMGLDLEKETRTERMQMLWSGFSVFDKIAHELDIAHKHVGLLLIARNELEIEKLRRLEHLAKFVPGGTVRRVHKKELLEIEPNVTSDAIEGLYDSTGVISIFGPEYVIAVYENARENLANIMLETECIGIEEEKGFQTVLTNKGSIKARFVVNCAGKYADKVADMANARSGWNLVFYRSQALVFDKKLNGLINNIVGIPPDAGKIDFFYPLGEGNIHVYAGYYDPSEDKEFMETTQENYDDAFVRMKSLVPRISEDNIITAYVGMRTFNDKEFEENIIEYSPRSCNFINVLVRMPGFTPAPAIAQKVVGMLGDSGLELKENENFNPKRKGIPRFRFLLDEERKEIIAKDSRYGRVICRCETVTEGEIVEAIRRGATTVQGVMFRSRAGMGRCQRNWCGPKIIEILSRELGRKQVTYKGSGFEYFPR